MKSQKLGPLHRRRDRFYCFEPSPTGTGRGREVSLRTDNLGEAKQRYQELVARYAAGELPTRRDQTILSTAIDQYLIHRRTRLQRGSLAAENSIAKALLAF